MTTEEFDALPEDEDVERWIIDGRLYEHRADERDMTRRSFPHSRTEANIAYCLKHWIKQQPTAPGLVVSGEAGFRLRREPVTNVGIDVAYVTAEQVATTPPNASVIEGPPVLAVEILSPSDQYNEVTNKIEGYLGAGVLLVWRVEPQLRLITVFRPDLPTKSFSPGDELTAEPHLPGFRVAVSEIFA